jgi:miniconductance mechanosensitive channel
MPADLSAFLSDPPWLLPALQLALLVLVVWLSDRLAHSVLVRVLSTIVRAIPAPWGEAVLGRGVVARLAHVVPAMVVYSGIALVHDLPEQALQVVRSVASAYVVLVLAQAFGSLLNALNDIYVHRDPARASSRPIKGYLQLLKIGIGLLAAVLIIARLFDRDPLLLLSGLGAMTAVLLLVFKDTLLSLVASVQLSSNDMLRVGDWIEMPQLNANGAVIDMSLHTVKVQNWDATITTIPTWRLISESYKNWRGMFESGGRRITRSLFLDQTSVRFLTDDETDELRRVVLIDDYLASKTDEMDAYNAQLLSEGKDPVNTRHATNLGTFRAYVQAYLRANPRIHQDKIMMVRQLQPGPTGLPLEIYCFTATTAWVDYEGIQADIFDHLYAILPTFGLRVFQSPSGADLTRTYTE